MNNASDNVYALANLTKRYPKKYRPANDDISFTVEAGEIFGLLGDNGAGKSTLVKQMANLVRPSSGSVKLFGTPVEEDPMLVPRFVGYMPQSGRTLNSLTVAEAIYFTAHLRGLSRREALTERERLLHVWQLEESRDQLSSRLSGGQQRLLQLAVAMAGQPPVLILDEPTNELAPQRRRHVWETLRAENQELGTTIIFITHDAIEAEKIIQRVGIMREGRLVALGKLQILKGQVDQQLRLEIRFPPDTPPVVPADFSRVELSPGHWLIRLDRRQVETILAVLNQSQLEDFQLKSATLEDLYLRYNK